MVDERRWSQEFFSALGDRAPALRREGALEARLEELVQAGRRAWPDLALPAASFVRHLALHASAAGDPERALADLRSDDLYLACACAQGTPGAQAALEARFFPALVRAVSRVDSSAEFADEVKQELRARLFMPGKEGRPAIAGFAGAGPLAGWLRISAQRIALNLIRKRPARALALDEQLLAGNRAPPDPELELLKTRFRPEFDRALRESLAALSTHERLLLRMHYVDGLSTRQIGRLEGKNQSTVSRAVAAARAKLRESTLRALGERLRLSASQLDSIVGLVVSRLELSLGGALVG